VTSRRTRGRRPGVADGEGRHAVWQVRLHRDTRDLWHAIAEAAGDGSLASTVYRLMTAEGRRLGLID
jgi:hypothetical protein